MLSKNHFNAVVFDLDGTLRHNRPPADDMLFQGAVTLGLPDNNETYHQALRWAHYYWGQSPELLEDRETYQDEDQAFFINYAVRYLNTLGFSDGNAAEMAPKLHQHMVDNYNPENWIPPDVPETLTALQEAGYTLGLLSNRSEPCDGDLESWGLSPFFQFAFVAGEVDVWKPDPAVFEHALERGGSSADDTIYIGDNYYADILGAQSAGLQPVLIDPKGVFPEAKCPVIHSVGELIDMLAPSS